jgi:tape measure domain-containing protein
MATDTEALIVQMSVDLSRLEKGLAKAVGDTQGAARRMEREHRRLAQTVRQSSDAMAEDFRKLIAAFAVQRVASDWTALSDTWTNAANKLRAVGVESQFVSDKQRELADLAIRTRSGYAETVDLYAKLTRASADLGASQTDILRVTETVNKALQSSGASAQEANSAILQLSQGLSSGVLAGDELRALRETSPVIIQAIADEFGVAVGKIKDLGAAGELTSARVFQAILRASAVVDETFAKTELTIGGAMQNLTTRLVEYVGTGNEATGVSLKIADAINFVAENFHAFADAAFIAVSTFATGAGAFFAFRLAGTLAGIAASAGTATVAMTHLSGALALLGGPWGAILIGIGAALIYLSERSSEATKKTLEFVKTQEENRAAVINTRAEIDKLAGSYKELTFEQQRNLRMSVADISNRADAAEREADAARAYLRWRDGLAQAEKEARQYIYTRDNPSPNPRLNLNVSQAEANVQRLQAEADKLREQAEQFSSTLNAAMAGKLESDKKPAADTLTEKQLRDRAQDAEDAARQKAQRESMLADLKITELEAQGRWNLADALRDELQIRENIARLIELGTPAEEAERRSIATQNAVIAEREERRRLYEEEFALNQMRELAALRGDEESLKKLDRLQREIDKTRELRDLGLPQNQANAEAKDIIAEEDYARMQGRFREIFSGAIIGAVQGDNGQFFEDWVQDKFATGMRRALNSLADLLLKVVQGAFSGAGSGSAGGITKLLSDGFNALFGGGKASGGYLDPRKFHLVGERGPEILGPGAAGFVTPNHALQALNQPMRAASAPASINYVDSRVLNFQGTGEEIAQFRRILDEDRAQRPSEILSVVAGAQERRVL